MRMSAILLYTGMVLIGLGLVLVFACWLTIDPGLTGISLFTLIPIGLGTGLMILAIIIETHGFDRAEAAFYGALSDLPE